MNNPVHTVGLLLAAGRGRRFDANAPGRKLREVLNGQSVAMHALTALAQSVDTVVVAVRDANDGFAVDAESRGALVVCPPDADSGMGHSLAHAANAVVARYPSALTWVIALADMPWVRAETIRALVEASRLHDCIMQPRHNGLPGNPVVFPARFSSELERCEGDVGARVVLRAHASECRMLDVDDAGVLRDVDVPGDLVPSAP